MTRTLFLHIGSHKTGTTSIQSCLAANRAALASHGYGYPVGSNDLNLGAVAGKSSLDGTMGEYRATLAARIAADPAPTVIASSEAFSYLHDGQDIQAFRDLLAAHFASIHIITYLRRQDQFAVSHHQEGANPQDKPAARLHGHAPTALPAPNPAQQHYLDYATRIGLWADAFGDAALVIRVYDRGLLKSGDAVADLLDIVGLGDVDLTRQPDKNLSMGFVATKLGHILNTAVTSTQTKASILARVPNDGKLLPRRDAARAFLAPYRDGNRRLNARFGINDLPDLFPDDFAAYPEQGQETWSEDTANAALTACAQVIEGLTADTASFTVEEYSAAAKALARTRPDLARKFLTAALNIRPGSARLRARLEKLQSRPDRSTT